LSKIIKAILMQYSPAFKFFIIGVTWEH